MTCCTANILRLFVRSLAQVDLPAASNLRSCQRLAQRSPIRTFTQPGSFGLSFQYRSNSTLSSTIEEHTQSGSKAQEVSQEKNGHFGSGKVDTGSAFVEFSLEAIDTIAAESKIEIASRQQRRERGENSGEEPIKPTFRHTQAENTSFAIHYSSPRLPPPAKSGSEPSRERRPPRQEDYRTPPVDGWVPPEKEHWQIQKAALKEKFPDGWNPQKRLSPDAMTGIRALHSQMPEKYTSVALADHFKVSVEAIRRILKSNWQPTADDQINREMRWFRRGEKVWSRYAELGVKPPRRWRDVGIGRGKPEWKNPKEPRAKPALLIATRRDGGYYRKSVQTNREPDRTPSRLELVTTKMAPDGFNS